MSASRSVDQFMTIDLPKGVALEECRRALFEVMKVWPNVEISSTAMYERAAEFLHQQDHDGAMSEHTLREFLACCRCYPTIVRSQTFWTVLQAVFNRDEALQLYLGQCLSLQSKRERAAIADHLRKVGGYSLAEIKRANKFLSNGQRKESRDEN